MNLERMTIRQKNALQLHGTQQRYDKHLRAKQIQSTLYSSNQDFYTDSLQARMKRDKAELDRLIKLIKQKKLDPEVLEFNAVSYFYPSYILDHHFSHFIKVVFDSNFRELAYECENLQVIGAVFDQTVNLNFQKTKKPQFLQGKIQMEADTFFYSFKTSSFVNVACLEAENKNKQRVLVFVKIRNKNGELAEGVTMRDMGSTISGDYCSMGYRLDGVSPLFVKEVEKVKIFRKIGSFQAMSELNYSIQDLMSSLHLTVKYTSLRKQFSTLENTKQQRNIVQYQAVSGRIIDGFATLYTLSFLRKNMLTMPGVATFMEHYMPVIQQIILPRLIELRECCGGFGFLQVSGHPALIQRVAVRASQPYSTFIPDHPELMKRIFYYSSDDQLEQEYMKAQKTGLSNLSIFAIICIHMKKRKDELPKQIYMREFISQICIQLLNRTLAFTPPSDMNGYENLLNYILVGYILENSKYLDQKVHGKEPAQFAANLLETRTNLLIALAKEIPEMFVTMSSFCCLNAIVGSEDSKLFYEQVYQSAKGNLRNHQTNKKAIQKPLVDLMREERAKL